MPSATVVSALIVNDTTQNRKGQDNNVHYKDMRPKNIRELFNIHAYAVSIIIPQRRICVERKYTLHIKRRCKVEEKAYNIVGIL